MAKTSTTVKVGKRLIELSNLDKVLFPADHVVKAELIEYYLKIGPTILRHIKGRPLSLVRYPDGIGKESFFQKNMPGWAPPWIERVTLGQEPKDYALAGEEAALVYLANLACIEMHQIHSRQPHLDKPDYFVFDLDPAPAIRFVQVVEMAAELKRHIESYGYHTFVKTTGGKGVHILAPIEPKWDIEATWEAFSAVAKSFVDKRPRTTTLSPKKDARTGKIFIDIIRNRHSQTIVSPYSVRGRDGAPVSMPLHWEDLFELKDPLVYNVRTALDFVLAEGDPWEPMSAYAARLHTVREAMPTNGGSKKQRAEKPGEPAGAGEEDAPEGDPPASLSDYARKRKFNKTPEPPPDAVTGEGNGFVIHRHHASRLHYDLRLEMEGALRSWAVPRGMPFKPGLKRLAVAVEDHPLSYATFEGKIPKGQYGAGDVWVFAHGKYEILKQKKDGFYFSLRSLELNADYRLIHTKDKDWLLERLDNPQIDYLSTVIEPMLAEIRKTPLNSPDCLYEVKWDGIRAMVSMDEGQITIRSRSGRDITKHFPELLNGDQAFRAASGLFDGEIVCMNDEGKPVFEWAVRRIQQSSESGIERIRAKHPAICYVFDCLYLDGRPIINEPLERRRQWMADSLREESPYRVNEAFDDGIVLFEAAQNLGLEGIVAKQRSSVYLPGRRSSSWLKIKTHQTADCIVIGYTKGKGDRAAGFGALQLAAYRDADGDKRSARSLSYLGKVGTGFNDRQLGSIFKDLAEIPVTSRPFKEKPLDDAQTVWLEPQVVAEVRYSSLTKEDHLREPVFLRLRPDKTPDDCEAPSQA